MDLAAVERALSASRARPILADARLVRRVIKRHRHLPGVGLQVPHARCYALGREELLAIVDAAELGRAAKDLPEHVILLPRPEPGEIARRPAAEVLGELWRYAFHARIHQEVDRLAAEGALTPARIRERVHRIGQTEFDEIRVVLRQDGLLLPPRDDLGTYAEFAALYLELAHFAPGLLGEVFPTLAVGGAAERALAEDLDVPALLEATRPEGAELPRGGEAGSSAEASTDEEGAAPEPPHRMEAGALTALATAARSKGNVVRSALLLLRAGRTDDATADADALAERLSRALEPAAEGQAPAKAGHGGALDTAAWSAVLLALMKRAASLGGIFRRVEARLLYDVQNACLAGEKAIGKVSLVDWALSLGRRPLARLLPATRKVRVARKLESAARKVPRVGLPEAERTRLRELLVDARHRADEGLREELRPAMEAALRDVGFEPGNVPERVALAKIVEELLDQATAHGHLGLGQLRDAVSRNQLKMADVAGPGELFGADALLAADRRLAADVDGVHQRGEAYLRGLQKASSLLFGTRPGRWLTFYVLLPLGGGFMLPFATPLIINEMAHLLRLVHLLPAEHHHQQHGQHHHLEMPSPAWVVACSVLLFGLVHSGAVRAAALQLLRVVGFVLATIFVRVPRWIVSLPVVQLLLRSRVVLALGRFVVKPALVGAAFAGLTELVSAYLRHHHVRHHHHHESHFLSPFLPADLPVQPLHVGAVMFVVSAVALNTRAGILAEEIGLDAAARFVGMLHQHFFPGLFRLVASIFRRLTDALDRGLYAVDEWLRFQTGQGRTALVLKGVLGVFWFAIAYLLRVLVNLFMEPTFNPIKHFPTVTVAAKIMWATVGPALHSGLEPVVGAIRAGTITGLAMAVLPGFFGFLVWELKENYKLYRATRAATLRPVSIGHHGETMGGLLEPGLHSGTLPKLWAKLRRAARKGDGSVEKHREALREIEEAVERFVDRELSRLLAESERWKGSVHVVRVALASNRVRVELGRVPDPGEPHSSGHPHRTPPVEELCAIAFEEQSGWLVAGVAHAGWAAALTGDERVLFENALGGLYQRAGVDLVREQIEAALPVTSRYDIADEGLVVWPVGHEGEQPAPGAAGWATEIVYRLGAGPKLTASVRGDAPADPPQELDRSAIVFGQHSIAWDSWVEAWTGEPRRLVQGASLLPRGG